MENKVVIKCECCKFYATEIAYQFNPKDILDVHFLCERCFDFIETHLDPLIEPVTHKIEPTTENEGPRQLKREAPAWKPRGY